MATSLSCIYGKTTHGKTSLLGSVLAYHLARSPAPKARLYTCENFDCLESWIRAGVLDVLVLDGDITGDTPFDTLRCATQGWWVDTRTGKFRASTSEEMNAVGLWFFEGLATIGDWLMGGYSKGGLAARSGRGDRVGPAEETISFTDGASKIGGNPRTHYNIAQRELHGAVMRSKCLPEVVIWTSHEVVAKDDKTNKPILGPELVGTAATDHATRWFGNTLHAFRMDKTEKDTKSKEILVHSDYRMYLKPHYSEELPTVPYRAVVRVDATVQAECDKMLPDYIPANDNTWTTFMDIRRKVDEAADAKIASIRSKRGGSA